MAANPAEAPEADSLSIRNSEKRRVSSIGLGIRERLDTDLVDRAAYDPDALALRGQYLHDLADDDAVDLGRIVGVYARALRLISPQKRPALFQLLVEALCEIIPIALCMERDLESILATLERHFDDSHPGRPGKDSRRDSWRRWLRALVLGRFGSHRRAKTLLDVVQRHLKPRHGLPEKLTAAIDLGEIHMQHAKGRRRLVEIVTEAVYRYRSVDDLSDDQLSYDRLEARAALLLWRDHVLHDDLDDIVHRWVRVRVGRWMRKDLAKRRRTPDYLGPSFTDALKRVNSSPKEG